MTVNKIKDALRPIVPFALWQTVGFLKRLPSYWRVDRSDALRTRKGLGPLALYVTPDISVFTPESVTCYTYWLYHGVQWNESSREALDFLCLSEGARALIDIGAQTGFMSALFARSREGMARILSVEPDPAALVWLHRARELNGAKGTRWEIAPLAVSDRTGPIDLRVTNIFYEPDSQRRDTIEVQAVTLEDLLQSSGFVPDIVKIDIEGGEYELLVGSLRLIERLKPMLQLEIHWEFLCQRGLAADDFLCPLADMGYRGTRRRYHSIDAWRRLARREPVSRLALSAL